MHKFRVCNLSTSRGEVAKKHREITNVGTLLIKKRTYYPIYIGYYKQPLNVFLAAVGAPKKEKVKKDVRAPRPLRSNSNHELACALRLLRSRRVHGHDFFSALARSRARLF